MIDRLHASSHLLHLSTLGNHHVLIRPISGSSSVFNHSDHVHPVDDLPKDNMFLVQKRSGRGGDEELAPIGIRA